MGSNAPVGTITARAYTVPTDAPEADGTFAWQKTTLVVVTIEAGGVLGLGYTYSAEAITGLVKDALAATLRGRDVFDIPHCHRLMLNAVRNLGRSGLAATAISAVDA
ncbi:MAG TPA: mandelate racemase, partial [Bradyrhizobium sp.]|nr:mandelate racemase [Bradyrhizobium sp.]